MKQNKYDDAIFFGKYKDMGRSQGGLEAAGEWHELRKMLPELAGKRVLDLGCGFGWHCRYAIENGAESAVGIDISENMLREAERRNSSKRIQYIRMAIEDIDFPADSFGVVISSLTLHYVESFSSILGKIDRCLVGGGHFVFSVEHPIFTAYGNQDWHCDQSGTRLHWPVDRYFTEGIRQAVFLGEEVTKYHRTLTTYLNSLIATGFELTGVVEPKPAEHLLGTDPEMLDELRRPMMLLVSARKRR
jgi:SAM-dependent methyltransferase